jgi:hypothetical protein
MSYLQSRGFRPAGPHEPQKKSPFAPRPFAGERPATAQRALVKGSSDQEKRETRNSAARLRPLGNNRYRETATSNVALDLLYLPDTDQYTVAEDTYWDPETGDILESLGNNLYMGMDGESTFSYIRGHYVAVQGQGVQEPALAGDLTAFIDDVWGIRGQVAQQGNTKARIDYIYNLIYSRGQKQAPNNPAMQQIVENLVGFSAGKNAHLQGRFPIPPDGEITQDIAQLFQYTEGFYSDQVQTAAWRALFKGHYYYRINDGAAANTRLIVNCTPQNVPATLATLYAVVAQHQIVQAIKAAGPAMAAQKVDSIVIYADRTGDPQAWQALLQAIGQTQIATVDAVPGLTEPLAQGLAVADEPPQVGGRSISFGQKRCILAYMALYRSGSKAQFTTLLAEFFEDAGIDTGHPARERANHVPNPQVQAELGTMLAKLNA